MSGDRQRVSWHGLQGAGGHKEAKPGAGAAQDRKHLKTILGAAGGASRRQEAVSPLGVGRERGAEEGVEELVGLAKQAAPRGPS